MPLRPHFGQGSAPMLVQKYANHSSLKVTEEFYDLNTEALELKSQAVAEARKIFKLGGGAAKCSLLRQTEAYDLRFGRQSDTL